MSCATFSDSACWENLMHLMGTMQEADSQMNVEDRIRDALATQAASTRAEFVRALESQKSDMSDLTNIAAEVLHTRDQQVRPPDLHMMRLCSSTPLAVHCQESRCAPRNLSPRPRP